MLVCALLLLAALLAAACACVVAVDAEARAFYGDASGRRAAAAEAGAADGGGPSLAEVAQEVFARSVEAATPAPPTFAPPDELGPQRLWQPTFLGCPSVFVEGDCAYYQAAPRLAETDLDRLTWERAARMGQTNLVEPLTARQSWAQLLTMDARSRKDPYTRAAPGNSLERSVCRALREEAPEASQF